MEKSKKLRAVLIGDIVNFTKLNPATEKKLLKSLSSILTPYSFEFYRGDSFQAYIKEPKSSLRIALLCRTYAISQTKDKRNASYDIRISIGIGAISEPVKKLASAKGEAFLLSGRAFDELQKKDTRLIITTGNSQINTGLEILADYINVIFSNMTAKQAEVISGLLMGQTQQDVVAERGKSKSTVSQLAASGRWPEIKKLLQHFENLIDYLL
ncbi:MAG: hypothetical protein BGO55_12840 [Sphingobacteriales bacterium 50-39]|nr:hypothetical protein [Sphingobacteriales bacterium]OJW57195.1 MAG: hypothetical protein BGO55_12840 [Sphingobacteriales bacterium 50-39]